jgi:hypothetical protein
MRLLDTSSRSAETPCGGWELRSGSQPRSLGRIADSTGRVSGWLPSVIEDWLRTTRASLRAADAIGERKVRKGPIPIGMCMPPGPAVGVQPGWTSGAAVVDVPRPPLNRRDARMRLGDHVAANERFHGCHLTTAADPRILLRK